MDSAGGEGIPGIENSLGQRPRGGVGAPLGHLSTFVSTPITELCFRCTQAVDNAVHRDLPSVSGLLGRSRSARGPTVISMNGTNLAAVLSITP